MNRSDFFMVVVNIDFMYIGVLAVDWSGALHGNQQRFHKESLSPLFVYRLQ
ncbi:hypothetical protein [Priestia megaterium]|uniref:hypothetical protein n=1 Tax=Priestia megaterium TaxID=1404 RepID=UPI00148263E1|nr:hypothetical protein [Priestia megaterium]MCE4091973.1 hypothetical protein [Priestia megaterium]MED4116157.1 hypothetical protein [Priestia megaterium]MED4735417.1 hypothetical protein [Priestia megaterium]